jgi:hypothetical protein
MLHLPLARSLRATSSGHNLATRKGSHSGTIWLRGGGSGGLA